MNRNYNMVFISYLLSLQLEQKDADLETMLRETGILQEQLSARQGELVDATTQLASSEERGLQLQKQVGH